MYKLLIVPFIVLLAACAPTPFDPNLSAVNAENQAKYYSALATGTAYAQIIPITQQAAAAEAAAQAERDAVLLAQIKASALSTQQFNDALLAAQQAQDALALAQAQAQATSTQQASAQAFMVQQEADRLQIERNQRTNTLRTVLPILLTIVVVILAITAAGAFLYSFWMRTHYVGGRVDVRTGRILPLLNVWEGLYTDIERSDNATVGTNASYLLSVPLSTRTSMDAAVHHAQFSDMHVRVSALIGALPKTPPQSEIPAFMQDMAQPVLDDRPVPYPEIPYPEWTQLNQWDGKLLPFGVDDQNSLLCVDTNVRAHLMFVGRTRSGKTLTGIRTTVACLLTQGWNVVCMGKRVDWMPFEDHPNFNLIACDVRKDAYRYTEVLQALSAQMDVRDSLMAGRKVNTWELYGAPSTMIVLDDYSGALMRMEKDYAKEVRQEVMGIALDGAKYGLSLTIGLQDATAANIETTLRSQMARVVYSLDTESKSRVVLDAPGAELLPPFRHFLTRITDDAQLVRGVGFFMKDREVEAFLRSRPVKANDPERWIHPEVIDMDIPEDLPEVEVTQPPSTVDRDADIRRRGWAGESIAQIMREVLFDNSGGGSNFNLVKAVLSASPTKPV